MSASLVANYAHTNVPPPGASPDRSPRPGAIVLSLCWPVLLFVAAEILVRTPWPRQLRWHAVRYLGLLPIAGVAAFVSYRHMSGLLTYYGEDRLASTMGLLAIDGLMVMATGALLATAHPVSAKAKKPSSEANPEVVEIRKASKQPRASQNLAVLLKVANEIAAELKADGTAVSRRRLAEGLRTHGHQASNARVAALMHSLSEGSHRATE